MSVASQAEAFLRAGGMSGQIVAGPAAEPQVYMGKTYDDASVAPEPGTIRATVEPGSYPWTPIPTKVRYGLKKAQAKFYSMSGDELASLYKYGSMWAGGDISRDGQSAQTAWNTAVEAAVQTTLITGVETDPWTALKQMASRVVPKDPKTEGVTKTTSINLSSPEEARAYISQALQTELGRAPDDAEMGTFIGALTQYQNANPSVTTTTSVPGVNGAPTENTSITSGGGNTQQFASEYAASLPGAAEYKGATTFVDTLLNAIKSPIVPE
jgi:hypothetical protein